MKYPFSTLLVPQLTSNNRLMIYNPTIIAHSIEKPLAFMAPEMHYQPYKDLGGDSVSRLVPPLLMGLHQSTRDHSLRQDRSVQVALNMPRLWE